MTILIATTNWWHNPARLANAFAKAGARIAVICPKGSSVLSSRVVEMRFKYRALRPIESLEEAIAGAKPDLIIVGDDMAVDHLHELYLKAVQDGPRGAQTRDLIERSIGEPANFENVRSRYQVVSIAREEGILVPESAEIKSSSDLDSWRERHSFPWVLKMDGNCGGQGVRVVHTMPAARWARRMLAGHPTAIYVAKRLLANRDLYPARPWLRRENAAVSVQAFVRGTPANISVAAWKGEVIASFSVIVSETVRKNGPASVVRLTDNPAMRLAAERLASRLKLSGFFGLDFMIEQGTEKAYLIELNPRVTQLCHLPLGRGRDLTKAIYEKLSGAPAEGAPLQITGDKILIFPNAWMQNLGDEVFATGYHDVPWEDPEFVNEMLKPIWCDRGLLHSAIERVRSLRRNEPKETGPDHRHRQLRRPANSDAMTAMDSAKTNGAA